ncbi:MAG: polyketide synthase, partial [Thiotrichaceae bacterium]
MADTKDSAENVSLMREALKELRKARKKIAAFEQAQVEPIAIIGIGCRFPGGVSSPAAFWRLLENGMDAVTETPVSRWDNNYYYDPDPDAPGKISTRYGAFIEQVDKFDAGFFGVSPHETKAMDPQQRLLLETSWEALENAGIEMGSIYKSNTGVFIGISNVDYLISQAINNEPGLINAYAGTGNALSASAGRISYLFGFQGPSLAIDTACSSSLVTLHNACESLKRGECNLALAGGVNLLLTPETSINFSKARMMSSDGRCKTFDATANGYVRGEGCGILVLKRLSDAKADGDTILSLIRASAVNQDGPSSGFTVPHGPSQSSVIQAALNNAKVDSSAIQYVEAHGTGTSLGDPIEI